LPNLAHYHIADVQRCLQPQEVSEGTSCSDTPNLPSPWRERVGVRVKKVYPVPLTLLQLWSL